MTDLAEEIDLDAAAEGVKSLYKAPSPRYSTPRPWIKVFWSGCHSPPAGAC